ncbi:MAG: hypothetical protein ACMXYM_03060 [Candidatus Woesearchaeota archaeon]
MDLKVCQSDVKEYFAQLEENRGLKPWPRFVILARLEEEISEIGRIISVEEGYRQRSKVEGMNYTDEFGDALFQIVHLANECGVDLGESWEHMRSKYENYTKRS